jgi:pimeloyl-ACP methyl ester carboxylesterase
MGSQLGVPRPALPPDLLWLDPIDIVDGRLLALLPAPGDGIEALGCIPYSYLPLALRLRAAGFAVVLHAYDWRRDLNALAAELDARLQLETSAEIAVVAHSMGGLLARAALNAAGGRRVTRLITLGTPHAGSLAAVQALRGTYPAVRRLAAIDTHHSPEYLTDAVFKCLPSLYQLLPRLLPDLFEPKNWPEHGCVPDPNLLQAARTFLDRLPPPDERCIALVGTGQRTVTALSRAGNQFRYQVSSQGDGTVPAASARLPGAANYFLRCEHSELPRHPLVAQALSDLLLRGHTRRLRRTWSPRGGETVSVTDAALARVLARKLDWYRLGHEERRRYLNSLNAPPPVYRRHHSRSSGSRSMRASCTVSSKLSARTASSGARPSRRRTS